MPRERSPDRDKAFGLYKLASGNIELSEIAEQLGVPSGTVRGWKNKDNWNARLSGTERKRLERPKTPREARRKMALSVIANEELSDFEKNFCLHYIECYDLGTAAIRAGSVAREPRKVGWALMQRPDVRDEIHRLKAIKAETILAGPDDVVERMMRIAFADITDFVEFGRVNVPVMTAFGPLKIRDQITGEEITIMKEVNDVRLKDHTLVDGAVIGSVKVGRDGASIKLADKQRALEWLADYFGMNPADTHKQAYDQKRLELEERRVKLEEQRRQSNDEDLSKLDAIMSAIDEVMQK